MYSSSIKIQCVQNVSKTLILFDCREGNFLAEMRVVVRLFIVLLLSTVPNLFFLPTFFFFERCTILCTTLFSSSRGVGVEEEEEMELVVIVVVMEVVLVAVAVAVEVAVAVIVVFVVDAQALVSVQGTVVAAVVVVVVVVVDARALLGKFTLLLILSSRWPASDASGEGRRLNFPSFLVEPGDSKALVSGDPSGLIEWRWRLRYSRADVRA